MSVKPIRITLAPGELDEPLNEAVDSGCQRGVPLKAHADEARWISNQTERVAGAGFSGEMESRTRGVGRSLMPGVDHRARNVVHGCADAGAKVDGLVLRRGVWLKCDQR